MVNEIRKQVKVQSHYMAILRSFQYKNSLDKMANRIANCARIAPNEATIESKFDNELFSFFREQFGLLGFEFNPIKEKSLDTDRTVIKGRADSAISSFIMEYKQPSTLHSKKSKDEAVEQIGGYLKSVYTGALCRGFITDGTKGCFVAYDGNNVSSEPFYELTGETLDTIIRIILEVQLIEINPKTLVRRLCNPPVNDGDAFRLSKALYKSMKGKPISKTLMLFEEWKKLFNLAHDDISKQQAIVDRKKSLENIFHESFENNDNEYKALFCLQTAYAIIVKSIAFKVISQVRFKASLIEFHELMNCNSETLRLRLMDIEDGSIFIKYGILNLLEGDFFSWYTNSEQWDNDIYVAVSKLYATLSKFSGSPAFTVTRKCQDFFKELYVGMIPAAVRHSLGEYYTKKWLAKNVVDEVYHCLSNGWKGLDPCCGSGTFLTVMIEYVIREDKGKNHKEILDDVLSRVKGIDINPIAVLTARVNYFINISYLLDEEENIELPVFLGDSSYVPQIAFQDGKKCIKYEISTIKQPIHILVPLSMVNNSLLFSRTMSEIETDIKALNRDSVYRKLINLCDPNDLTQYISANLKSLATQLVDLEKKKWNGVWARILTNFLNTANLEKFDLVVGNPPWVDWKSLPSGYRDKIKSLCISRKLFSGDSHTGGINLNICALITNVVAQNWLSHKGYLAFLMPEPLIFQQSYEGFRNLYVGDGEKMYFNLFVNWNKAGHPFAPVQQKFLTYYMSYHKTDYSKGVLTKFYIKKVRNKIDEKEELNFEDTFREEDWVLGTCNKNRNFFTYAKTSDDLANYLKVGKENGTYIGREGIEFYPQELLVFKRYSRLPDSKTCIAVINIQNPKSKYKILQSPQLLEKRILRPMIKGVDITPFHVGYKGLIVPFPYKKENPQVPMKIGELTSIAPNLAKYYLDNKSVLDAQTGYSNKIIGKKDAGFYALARVGAYSFADNYVIMRDNSSWCAAVVTKVDTSWGGLVSPVFQNHAISICENKNGGYITYDEAHYICGILNSPIVYRYMMYSTDTRSFPIRPRINIPQYDPNNKKHVRISELSKLAHKLYDNERVIKKILLEINDLYLNII